MAHYDYVIVGGGIAGVSCAETLSYCAHDSRSVLVSASPVVKVATRFKQVTKVLEEFDVEEQSLDDIAKRIGSVGVLLDQAVSISHTERIVRLASGVALNYGKLCLCTGGKPKLIARNNPYVIGIRDTETVQEFQKRLQDATRVIIVGNGGIATEMVSELENVDVVWVVKHKSISATFVDAGAAEFFLKSWSEKRQQRNDEIQLNKPSARLKYTESSNSSLPSTTAGSALGPDWAGNILMSGKFYTAGSLQIEYECEIAGILTPDECLVKNLPAWENGKYPVYAELTNGKIIGCDFIVSATGVIPNVDLVIGCMPADGIAVDGGIKVNENMESILEDVFVAGDACTCAWETAPHWIQMRLWTQARQMGAYAARSMIAKTTHQSVHLDFAFELFAHITKFFGFKVVLLGLFNGQGLEKEYEILLRMTVGVEYIKIIVKNGKVQGAILIGDSDLEETFENLILNGTDVARYGEDLLNPDIDIEDYFD
ncbi:pyridine nucleotide-disulfide oxidoreductase domain-containing protein 1-like [Paramacrobiotus metropolitanus]|uniref:pyridine nucleotide-disulfide oxidoreductase domain-containing protein 1-like n=1 Tax=Paramacrobiotus metropolitanus TaxID=2943436 RepID=UPI002445ECB1|nr:pyridine nucleotide-disulfide oxidoreductase domain-containing protein 1-like [Paramacrobiotus metropolitanus]